MRPIFLASAVAALIGATGCVVHQHPGEYTYRYEESGYRYTDAHPVAGNDAWCLIQGHHLHDYAPDYSYYTNRNDYYVYSGPTVVWYSDFHPVPHGGHCNLHGRHSHDYHPGYHDASSYDYDSGRRVYVYRNPAPGHGASSPARPPPGQGTGYNPPGHNAGSPGYGAYPPPSGNTPRPPPGRDTGYNPPGGTYAPPPGRGSIPPPGRVTTPPGQSTNPPRGGGYNPPPGHGGTPPGHGGTPPGHNPGNTPPGHVNTPPSGGSYNPPPGHGGTPPGRGGTPPGQNPGNTPPGHVNNPGRGGRGNNPPRQVQPSRNDLDDRPDTATPPGRGRPPAQYEQDRGEVPHKVDLPEPRETVFRRPGNTPSYGSGGPTPPADVKKKGDNDRRAGGGVQPPPKPGRPVPGGAPPGGGSRPPMPPGSGR